MYVNTLYLGLPIRIEDHVYQEDYVVFSTLFTPKRNFNLSQFLIKRGQASCVFSNPPPPSVWARMTIQNQIY